jgi:hypothetical protein
MTVVSAVERTDREGTLTLNDGTGSITVDFLEGDLEATVKNVDYVMTKTRGANGNWLKGEKGELDFSFTCKLVEIVSETDTNFAALFPHEAIIENEHTHVTTTASPTSNTKVFSVILKIDDPATTAYETITFSECVFPTVTLSPGYPKTISVQGKAKTCGIVYTAAA